MLVSLFGKSAQTFGAQTFGVSTHWNQENFGTVVKAFSNWHEPTARSDSAFS